MSLTFEALTPQQDLRPWNKTHSVLELICDHLSIPDLCSFAQVSRDFQKAAYHDKFWIDRLKNLGVSPANISSSYSSDAKDDLMIGDSEDELSPLDAVDSFTAQYDRPNANRQARTSFMRLYRTLQPLYDDLVKTGSESSSTTSTARAGGGRRGGDPVVFKAYQDPIDQAKVLGQIKKFAHCDPLETNHDEKLSSLNSTIDLFENAALAEFELGYDAHDLERLKQYSTVLVTLNGGDNCVQLFIQKHPLLNSYDDNQNDGEEEEEEEGEETGRPPPFVDQKGGLKTEEFEKFLRDSADSLNSISKDVDYVFGNSIPVMIPLLERFVEDNLMDKVSAAIDSSREKSLKRYVRLVPEIYVRLRWFSTSLLQAGKNSGSKEDFIAKSQDIINESFTLQVDLYLAEELQNFVDDSELQVTKWNNATVERQQQQETLLWSNVNKEQDKSDFLSSFKKVLMMPVMPFHNSNSSSASVNKLPPPTPSSNSSRPITPGLPPPSSSSSSSTIIAASNGAPPNSTANTAVPPAISSPSIPAPPTTELDAMVAVMNNKLESISTLFSLELALTIIRNGRDSIERIGKLVSMGGQTGKDAREQCEQVFVELVRIVGALHVKVGFDRALDTLNEYNPRQHRQIISSEQDGENKNAVEPLAIFAELVNIGDLIQQMIHVFFEEELALRSYIDRNDFLSPAVKAKKRFEQSLDDSVANGLNRGIDVLVDQIDFTFVTVQLGSDYNPPAEFSATDIGPSEAAKKAVSLLSSHVTLLAGSTEKSVIDVFQQEIGFRFYSAISKHLKRQTISLDGSIKLISDLNYYYAFISSLKQRQIMPYFEALKEVGQLFLIDGHDAKALGRTLSDMGRFKGVMQPEEVFEFVKCRADWLQVRKEVEKVMYGFGVDCVVM